MKTIATITFGSSSQHPSSHPLTGADPQGFSPGCRLLPAPLLPSSERGRPAGLQSWLQAAIELFWFCRILLTVCIA
ncbi:unnamed protein product [Arctogadus glacialis]